MTAARTSSAASHQVSLEENSELPEPLRVTFRDEHPLMLGSANVAARLSRLAVKGTLSLQQTLPMQRKRDLLQLPQTNLNFETSLELEEESCKIVKKSAWEVCCSPRFEVLNRPSIQALRRWSGTSPPPSDVSFLV